MAASGFTPISLYYSTTASAVPLAANLANGELALNTADMKLYAKNSSGVVTLLSSSSGATGTVSSVDVSGGTTGLTTSGGPVTTSGTITLAGTLNVANGGTGKTSYTANGILYASGTGTLANGSALTFDGTNLSVTGTNTKLTNQTGADSTVQIGPDTPSATRSGRIGFITSSTQKNWYIANNWNVAGALEFNQTTTAGGSTMASTPSMVIDSTGNLGLGVAPSAWSLSGLSALQVKNGSLYGYVNEVGMQTNTYYNAGWKYITTGEASQYTQSGGVHAWGIAPSGTAGNPTSFTQAMTLNATQLGLGTSTNRFGEKLHVLGNGIVTSTAENTNLGLFGNFGSANLIMGAFSNMPLEIRTNNTARFLVGTAGQLGIGGATYGTAGQVLTSQGSGSAPTWAAAGGGAQAFVAFGSTGGF